MAKLVLVRHAQSLWNKENRFTGWVDVDLSEKGMEEARNAGQRLKDRAIEFDICYTSYLKRAIRTLWIALDVMDRMWLPVVRDWRLNERHYGGLQGLNKAETAAKFGEEQVHKWRRSLLERPPAIERTSEYYPGHDRRYRLVDPALLPLGENLLDTIARVMPCWHEKIAPDLKAGKNVLISAHGNSLRGLVKELEGISDEEINKLEIPTGVPIFYDLDDALTVKSSERLE